MIKVQKKPLVSVVITNYNYEQFVGEAIDSALAQTYDNIEVVVIDDGSTDGSRRVIRKYADKNKSIRYIEQNNMGVVAARNKGIDESRGEYLIFLDGDDMLKEDYVEKTLLTADKNNADVVYTDYKRFGDENGMSDFPEFNIGRLRTKNFIHISALIAKSAVGDSRFDGNLNKLSHEDWDFFLGLSYKKVTFKKSEDTYLMYRSHGQSRSVNGKEYALRAVKSYLYILEKYNERYPGTMQLSEESEIVDGWCLANERLELLIKQEKLIDSKNKRISEKDAIIEEKDRLIASILNSFSYKVGALVTRPLSILKRLFKKDKK